MNYCEECGNYHVEKRSNRFIDRTGQKYGRLTVIKFIGITEGKKKRSIWLCKCDCGNQKEILGERLASGKTQSCGCLNKEINIKKSTKHGLSNTKIYFVWKAMISRCYNKRNPNYKNYGKRGIEVFKDWHELKNFYQWAMNNGYDENLEIERIDNNGNYEPNNCKWATRKEQTRNTRKNVNVEINGIIKTIAEWAEENGYKNSTIQYRYYRGDRGKRLIRPIQTECRTKRGGGM